MTLVTMIVGVAIFMLGLVGILEIVSNKLSAPAIWNLCVSLCFLGMGLLIISIPQ